MAGVVLDTSALLALLLEEPGSQKVEAVLAKSVLGAVNQAELYSYYARLGASEADVRLMLRPLALKVLPADGELAIEAGMLRSVTADAGLSLGDRFCLALGKREQLDVWTADRAWKDVAKAVGVKVICIR